MRAWSIAGTRPEECVDAVAIVIEIHDKKRICVNGVNVATDLVVVGVEFSDKLSPIWAVFWILPADCRAPTSERDEKYKAAN